MGSMPRPILETTPSEPQGEAPTEIIAVDVERDVQQTVDETKDHAHHRVHHCSDYVCPRAGRNHHRPEHLEQVHLYLDRHHCDAHVEGVRTLPRLL